MCTVGTCDWFLKSFQPLSRGPFLCPRGPDWRVGPKCTVCPGWGLSPSWLCLLQKQPPDGLCVVKADRASWRQPSSDSVLVVGGLLWWTAGLGRDWHWELHAVRGGRRRAWQGGRASPGGRQGQRSNVGLAPGPVLPCGLGRWSILRIGTGMSVQGALWTGLVVLNVTMRL